MDNLLTLYENQIMEEQLEIKELYIECMELEINAFLNEDNSSLTVAIAGKLISLIRRIINFFSKLGNFIKDKLMRATDKINNFLVRAIGKGVVIYTTKECANAVEEVGRVSIEPSKLEKCKEIIYNTENYARDPKNRTTADYILKRTKSHVDFLQKQLKENEQQCKKIQSNMETLEKDFETRAKKGTEGKSLSYSYNFIDKTVEIFDCGNSHTNLNKLLIDMDPNYQKQLDKTLSDSKDSVKKELIESMNYCQAQITQYSQQIKCLNFFLTHAIYINKTENN